MAGSPSSSSMAITSRWHGQLQIMVGLHPQPEAIAEAEETAQAQIAEASRGIEDGELAEGRAI